MGKHLTKQTSYNQVWSDSLNSFPFSSSVHVIQPNGLSSPVVGAVAFLNREMAVWKWVLHTGCSHNGQVTFYRGDHPGSNTKCIWKGVSAVIIIVSFFTFQAYSRHNFFSIVPLVNSATRSSRCPAANFEFSALTGSAEVRHKWLCKSLCMRQEW